MSIETQVEEIAKAAALTDPQDLQRLVLLQELFEKLSSELTDTNLDSLGEVSASTISLIEKIVFREIKDVEGAFEQIHLSIEYAQKVTDAINRGESVPSFISPRSPDNQESSDIDEELLEAWLASCADLLSDIEGKILEVESTQPTDELLAEIRRGIHTLKGECGVLSLDEAQTICHEVESYIEFTLNESGEFPVDSTLAVIDWMKTYISLLNDDPRAAAPAHQELLDRLCHSQNEDEKIIEVENASDEPKIAPCDDPVTELDGVNEDELVEMTMGSEFDEILNDFLCEARSHIADAEEALLSLEEDFTDSELINTVFRAFHTIKGVAGFMHLDAIVELAHNAEFLLDEARQTSITLNSAYLDLIFNSCDLIKELIGSCEGADGPTRGKLNALIARLQKASKGEIDVSTTTTGSRSKPDADSMPKPDQSASPEPKTENLPTDLGSEKPLQPTSTPTATSGTPQISKKETPAARKRIDHTVKVKTQRLDNLVTMVGELVIAQQMVVQDENLRGITDQRFKRNLGHSGKIIRDLQEVAMSLRMVTLKGTFQNMARLVRDISGKAGKDIRFHMEGEDTELDRNVVEEIGDPLVHMVRNSCDHGIGTPEERLAADKTGTGHLTLRAYHQGGSIIIELEDDGKGLNRDRILQKAIERGIFAEDQDLTKISDKEVYNLIMAPGFSTAEKVTDISGRGVGMDVVRRNIESLRGKVEIKSKLGKGTSIFITLPLTLAIIDGMVVRVGTHRYVIPTLSIQQSFRPTLDELHTVTGRGEMVSVRGSLQPIYRLKQVFNLKDGLEDISDAILISLESNNTQCCVLVDEIIGQQQVVIKSLGQGVEYINGVSGGAILGDGQVALIVDVGGLINEATSRAA